MRVRIGTTRTRRAVRIALAGVAAAAIALTTVVATHPASADDVPAGLPGPEELGDGWEIRAGWQFTSIETPSFGFCDDTQLWDGSGIAHTHDGSTAEYIRPSQDPDRPDAAIQIMRYQLTGSEAETLSWRMAEFAACARRGGMPVRHWATRFLSEAGDQPGWLAIVESFTSGAGGVAQTGKSVALAGNNVLVLDTNQLPPGPDGWDEWIWITTSARSACLESCG